MWWSIMSMYHLGFTLAGLRQTGRIHNLPLSPILILDLTAVYNYSSGFRLILPFLIFRKPKITYIRVALPAI